MAQTDEEIAREQRAIFDTYAGWVDEIDQDPPPPQETPTDGDRNLFAYLLDATPEQQAALSKKVNDVVRGSTATEPSAD